MTPPLLDLMGHQSPPYKDEDDTSRAPSPFPEHGVVDTPTALRTSPDVASTVTVIITC